MHASKVLPTQPPIVGYTACEGCMADAGHIGPALLFLNVTTVPTRTVSVDGEYPEAVYVISVPAGITAVGGVGCGAGPAAGACAGGVSSSGALRHI